MISAKMQEALNAQIQAEMYSSNLYLAMSVWAEGINMKGFGHWFRIQSAEELAHAQKLISYLQDRGGKPAIGAIERPLGAYDSPLDVFERTLAHEEKVTAMVHGLYELALSEKDYASQTLLHWYISEQVEEEARATNIVEKLRKIGAGSNAVWWIDKELGKRTA
jgi:ferritin